MRRLGARGWPSKGPVLLAMLLFVSVALVASGVAAGGPSGSPVSPRPAAQLSLQPADGARDIAPADRATVSVSDGVLEDVALTSANGKSVAGRISDDRTSWTADELGYGGTYTWSGNARGTDGQLTPIAGSFATVDPRRQVTGTLNVADGATYGVAMPITLAFSSPVTDRATVERALEVHTSVPVEGAWAWLDDTSVHWRPKSYFPPNTQVSVSAKLYGQSLGKGSYGKADIGSTFTIGRSYGLLGDVRTHRLRVYDNGQQVADYPASFGMDSDPRRVTHSGIHVAMAKYPVYLMNNPLFNYANVEVRNAVRISNNGEFTHAAPWSLGQQGKRNVSHGCINLSPAAAKAVFEAIQPGDPVEITGSTEQLSARDGTYYDWAIPWETWLTKSALRLG